MIPQKRKSRLDLLFAEHNDGSASSAATRAIRSSPQPSGRMPKASGTDCVSATNPERSVPPSRLEVGVGRKGEPKIWQESV